MIQKITGTGILAVLLHLTFGWEATLLAGVVAGIWSEHPRVGAAGVGSAWAGWHLYRRVQAPEGYTRMLSFFSDLTGGLPGWVVPVLSVLLGVLLGYFGARLGTGIKRYWSRTARASHA